VTFSENDIKDTVARYEREYDRYLKLCARVAEICRDIVDANAIRAQVTSRAKTPKSFDGKLRRIVAGNKKPLTDLDSVFVHVRDLAAVRIATYEARHEAQVVDLVCKRFHTETGTTPVAEAKDYQNDPARRDNFYRATHVEACLPPADLVGTYANVARVPCEIQVCSMMAHVWNEIEHDLGYKPFAGSLSPFERDQLKHLGMMVRTADGIISQLLAATDQRLGAETARFSDVYDFVARIRPWFPGVDFGRHSGPLFEVLRPLLLLTPDAIRRQIDLPDPIAPAARQRCQDLGDGLFSVDGLDLDSSDLLLVALLPRMARIFARDPSGKEPGIARIRDIAEAYLKTQGKVDPDA
jgi:ppGpp synthetase/RelA/SpoT-type nucleotidyltranferase